MTSPFSICLDLRRVTGSRPHDWIIRFVFGGAITVVAGLIGKAFGPTVGGLFLAFPSILPASLTLLARRHGRDEAYEDARGAAVGSLGLVAFAGVFYALVGRCLPVVALAIALAAWLVFSVAGWCALAARRGSP